jgi:hypothetical protein
MCRHASELRGVRKNGSDDENGFVLGSDAANNVNSVPTFRENLPIPSFFEFLSLEDGANSLP